MKSMLYPWLVRLNIVMMPIFPRLVYRLKTTPIKISARFFHRNWQADLKSHMKMKGTLGSQNNLKKNEIGRLPLSDFKLTTSNMIKTCGTGIRINT